MYSWYKVFHGMPRDGKFKLIAHKAKTTMPNVLSVWLWLLDYASQQDTRGDIRNLDPEEVDVYYAFDEGTTQKILDEMERRNLIADGQIQHWERFQSNEAEKNRERQKRFREKHSAKNNVTETENNVTETENNVTETENNVTETENNVTLTLRNAQTRLDKIRQDNNIYTTATTEGGMGETKPPSQSSDCSPSDDGTAEVAAETPVSVPECNSVSLQGEDLPETSANDCEDEFDLKPQGNENKKSRGGVYTCAEAVRWWNKHMVAAGFTPVSAVTETRKRKFRLRQKFFKDAGAYGRAFWEEVVFPRLRRSKFIREKPNLNTLDWLLKGDEHIVRLNEGLYDDREEEAWN